MEVPAPAPPLGLLSLGDCSRAQLSCTLQPDDQLLLYTDGITEARDAKRVFYPLPERVSVLTAAATAAAGSPGARPRGRHRRPGACSTWSAPTCSSTSAPRSTTTRPCSLSAPRPPGPPPVARPARVTAPRAARRVTSLTSRSNRTAAARERRRDRYDNEMVDISS